MMVRPDPLIRITYGRFRDEVDTGWLGLVHGEGPIHRLIQNCTNSPYSHVFMLGWAEGRVLLVAESTRPYSRAVAASSQFKQYSGLIDVYKLKNISSVGSVLKAWGFMLRGTGQDYPEQWIVNNWLRINWGDRIEPIPNIDYPEFPRHCSGLIHAALRVAGATRLAEYDSDVYPHHFALPGVSEYVGTPIWEG